MNDPGVHDLLALRASQISVSVIKDDIYRKEDGIWVPWPDVTEEEVSAIANQALDNAVLFQALGGFTMLYYD